MPEVALVTLTQVAMDVATATLPLYRTKKSNHRFTQPQMVTILCLMCYVLLHLGGFQVTDTAEDRFTHNATEQAVEPL